MNDRSGSVGGGVVWWITGMSGAGKTTIAKLVQSGLRERALTAILLDGDVLRAVLGGQHGHSLKERHALAMTYARLAREIASQGVDAVCATISMFDDVRRWNREHIPFYREVYLRIPVAELGRRDSRGFYVDASKREVEGIVGVDLPLEEPRTPDLIIDNYGDMTPAQAAAQILGLDNRP